MRPTYESQKDRLNEERILKRFISGSTIEGFFKLPKRYSLDYGLLIHNEVRGFAEVKKRTHNHGDFPDLRISLAKVMIGESLTRSTGAPSILIIEWKCGTIGSAKLQGPFPTTKWGRTDRNDWQDMEPAAIIPLSKFTISKL